MVMIVVKIMVTIMTNNADIWQGVISAAELHDCLSTINRRNVSLSVQDAVVQLLKDNIRDVTRHEDFGRLLQNVSISSIIDNMDRVVLPNEFINSLVNVVNQPGSSQQHQAAGHILNLFQYAPNVNPHVVANQPANAPNVNPHVVANQPANAPNVNHSANSLSVNNTYLVEEPSSTDDDELYIPIPNQIIGKKKRGRPVGSRSKVRSLFRVKLVKRKSKKGSAGPSNVSGPGNVPEPSNVPGPSNVPEPSPLEQQAFLLRESISTVTSIYNSQQLAVSYNDHQQSADDDVQVNGGDIDIDDASMVHSYDMNDTLQWRQ